MAQQELSQQASQVKFEPYQGDLMGLITDDKHLVFKWIEPECKVLFSVTKQGLAASIHFSSDKPGLKHIKQAINEFCEFCYWTYDWCRMILGIIERPSVMRIVEKIGFSLVGHLEDQNCKIYMRAR